MEGFPLAVDSLRWQAHSARATLSWGTSSLNKLPMGVVRGAAPRAEAPLIFCGVYGTTEQTAEKRRTKGEPKKKLLPQGLKPA
jgi:hypothetical protein